MVQRAAIARSTSSVITVSQFRVGRKNSYRHGGPSGECGEDFDCVAARDDGTVRQAVEVGDGAVRRL